MWHDIINISIFLALIFTPGIFLFVYLTTLFNLKKQLIYLKGEITVEEIYKRWNLSLALMKFMLFFVLPLANFIAIVVITAFLYYKE